MPSCSSPRVNSAALYWLKGLSWFPSWKSPDFFLYSATSRPVFGVCTHSSAPAIPKSSMSVCSSGRAVLLTPKPIPFGFFSGITPFSRKPCMAIIAFSQFWAGFSCGDSNAARVRNRSRFAASSSSGMMYLVVSMAAAISSTYHPFPLSCSFSCASYSLFISLTIMS